MTQVISFTDYVPAARFDAVPWAHVKVEEGTTSAGPWVTLSTINLSPLDADPSNPQERDITVTNGTAPDLWYRLTFSDASGNTGQPSAPVQNADASTDSLATTADMEARLGITFTSDERDRAATLLDQASGLVRTHARQHITLVTGDTLVVPGNYTDRLRLPQRPVVQVTNVSAVFYNGTPFNMASMLYYLDRDDLVRYSFPVGAERNFYTFGNGWLGPAYTITVTYDHGFDPNADPVPYPLRLAASVALDCAIRAYTNPAGLAQSEIGGVLESYAPGSGMLLTAEEKWNIDDAFRTKSDTISLR